MGEERSLAGLIAVTLALGLVAAALALWVPTLTLARGLSVDTYEADYALDGSLAERYVYNVGAPGTYRMLFRTFDDPLVFNATTSPHIELVGVEPPDGVTGYARDASGTVRLYGRRPTPGRRRSSRRRPSGTRSASSTRATSRAARTRDSTGSWSARRSSTTPRSST